MIVYLSLLALGIGSILRNSAGSIGFYIGVIMILPQLATLLPWNWVGDVTPYAPGNVSNTIVMVDPAARTFAGDVLAVDGHLAVVTFGLAGFLLKRRDV